jgi:hypothetical protein
MSRFSSLNYSPIELRRILRARFASKLHVVRQFHFPNSDQKSVPDQIVLRLLTELRVFANAEWVIAEIAYTAAGPKDTEPADLQALASLGWIRQIWCRVRAGRDLRLAALRAPAGVLDAFKALLAGFYQRRYEGTKAARADPELADFVEAIEGGHHDPTEIICRNPEWVAGRLWEIIVAQEATPNCALRRWVDLWGILRYPSVLPGAAWELADARTFREAAISVIATEQRLGDWKETCDLYARQAELAHSLSVAVRA